ncbi:MAG: glutathione S-transferase family protein [Pseudomonadota bacterium]
MNDTRSIILHQYAASPFSEKIRLALRLKNLAWASVDIPVIMPKPDLMPLTGGYRRTPVMQIGADIYCDTAIILRELEHRYQVPGLELPGHEGLGAMVGAWTDGKWFQTSVGVIFGAMGKENAPPGFIEDREKLSGQTFDMDAMAAAAPMLRDQWRAQLMWLEERLQGGRGAGAGNYLVSTKPGLVDVHAYMNVWFVANMVPDFAEECFASAPRTKAWYERLKETTGQAPTKLSSEDALTIAKKAGPRLVMAVAGGTEPQGFEPGEKVAVAPDDYGKDWVEGTLVHADAQRIIVSRSAEEVETINVHFPRSGFMVRRV